MPSYNVLPDGYIKTETIDLKNNKKQFWFVNIGSLVLAVPLIILLFFFDYTIDFAGPQFLIIAFITFIAAIATIIIHELIHGLFFKIFAKGKLKFGFHGFAGSCCMPDTYFSKIPYLIIGLSPFIILNALFAVLSVLFYSTGLFLIFYFSLVINFSGCVGDLYVSQKLLRAPRTILVNDYGIGMFLYTIGASKKPD